MGRRKRLASAPLLHPALQLTEGIKTVGARTAAAVQHAGHHEQPHEVRSRICGGVLLLALFVWIETRVPDPMFRLELFKIRMFTFGNISSFLSALGRGGLQFMLIIWLQGIYLPIHGYGFSQTPLWAGIAMLPLTAGFLAAGPVSGWLSDRYGARPFATGGMVLEDSPPGSPAKLRVKFIGANGPHAVAKNAGVKQGDFVRSFDGREFARETDLIAHALTNLKSGDKVKVVLVRDGKDVEVSIPMQD